MLVASFLLILKANFMIAIMLYLCVIVIAGFFSSVKKGTITKNAIILGILFLIFILLRNVIADGLN